MKEHRKYRKPPVVEALCEIFFRDSAWDDTIPGRFYDRIKDDYPQKQQREVREAKIVMSPQGETQAGVRTLKPWMQFASPDKGRLVQLGQDLLVINQLRPYPRFDDWEPLIYPMLEKYREMSNPKGITRVGVRYINRVIIPKQKVKMSDYFEISPRLPKAMGDTHGSFMIRFEIPKEDGHIVFVTFGNAESETAEESAFMLDFYDVYQPPDGMEFEEVKAVVAKAHEYIEASFEGSITNQLRKLFDPED